MLDVDPITREPMTPVRRALWIAFAIVTFCSLATWCTYGVLISLPR